MREVTVNNKRVLRLIVPLLLIAVFVIFCSKKPPVFRPLVYFPLELNNRWTFSGGIQTMQVTEVTKLGQERLITHTFYDSMGVPLWAEKYRADKNQLYWLAFEPATMLLPRVTFDPPLYAAPFSNELGDVLMFHTTETQIDEFETTTALTVDYKIVAIEDVETPAGTFAQCIKLKIDFIYPPSTVRPLFIGDHYWWFSPTVGPVKYDLPTTHGVLLSCQLH